MKRKLAVRGTADFLEMNVKIYSVSAASQVMCAYKYRTVDCLAFVVVFIYRDSGNQVVNCQSLLCILEQLNVISIHGKNSAIRKAFGYLHLCLHYIVA